VNSEVAPRSLGLFVRTLAVHALPSGAQIDWLKGIGEVGQSADELGLEFDDGYRLLRHFIPTMWLATEAGPILDEMNALLEDKSGPTGPWSFDDLASDPRWERLRKSARRALSAIN